MAGIDVTSKSLPLSFINFTGGLNSTASGLHASNNELTECQNVEFDVFGSVSKRSGYAALNTSAYNSGAGWTGLHWFEQADGTKFLVGVCGDKIAKMDDLDGTWDDITGGLTVTDDDDYHWRFITFNNTVGAVNGYDAPFKLDTTPAASAMTLPTNVTVPKFIESYNNYVFIAHVKLSGAEKYSRVYWSNIDTLDTWTATDFNDINVDDGQNITGLKTLGDRLVIFKDRSIWLATFTGDSDIPFVFAKTPSSVGCISQGSVQEIENGLMFLAYDGFYYFDGQHSTKISDRISATLSLQNKARYDDAVGIYNRTKNKYLCAFTLSGQSSHSKLITWNSSQNAFGYDNGINANCFARIHVDGQERIYFGDFSGYVYRMDTGTDDYPANTQTAIDCYFYTKWFNFDEIVTKKGVPSVIIYYKIANATDSFSYTYDFEDSDQYTLTFDTNTSSSVYGSAVYGTGTYASEGGGEVRMDLTGRGRVVRFKLRNATLAETMRIDGIGALVHIEGYK